MELRNALGLITQTIFADNFGIIRAETQHDYQNTIFYVPLIICNDGWSVSIQIHRGASCESENGFRQVGADWKRVEWGNPNWEEPMLYDFSQHTEGGVGVICVHKMQEILDKHEGIDWNATLNIREQK